MSNIEFKNKYLKYKFKYFELLQQNNMTGGGNPTYGVQTKSNGGGGNGFSNSCFWISIRDYLRSIGCDVSLRNIRDACGVLPYEVNTMFDYDNYHHREGITRFCQLFNIRINIFSLFINYDTRPPRERIVHSFTFPRQNYDARFNINIINTGLHFEFIERVSGQNINILPTDRPSMEAGNRRVQITPAECQELRRRIRDDANRMRMRNGGGGFAAQTQSTPQSTPQSVPHSGDYQEGDMLVFDKDINDYINLTLIYRNKKQIQSALDKEKSDAFKASKLQYELDKLGKLEIKGLSILETGHIQKPQLSEKDIRKSLLQRQSELKMMLKAVPGDTNILRALGEIEKELSMLSPDKSEKDELNKLISRLDSYNLMLTFDDITDKRPIEEEIELLKAQIDSLTVKMKPSQVLNKKSKEKAEEKKRRRKELGAQINKLQTEISQLNKSKKGKSKKDLMVIEMKLKKLKEKLDKLHKKLGKTK